MPLLVDPRATPQQLEEAAPAVQLPAAADETRWLQRNTDAAFVKLGARVAKSPWTTLLVTTLAAVVCFAGIFSPNMVYESKSENLWVPMVRALTPAHAFSRHMISHHVGVSHLRY